MSELDKIPTSQLFVRAVGGTNFMTPQFIRYYRSRGHIAELSTGKDINGGPIYGVTVVNIQGDKPVHDHEKSQMFFSQEFAEAYMRGLK